MLAPDEAQAAFTEDCKAVDRGLSQERPLRAFTVRVSWDRSEKTVMAYDVKDAKRIASVTYGVIRHIRARDGQCCKCGETYRLKRDGTIPKHGDCRGSGRLPVAT